MPRRTNVPIDVKALETERRGNLGDLVGEAVEVVDVVRLRAPARKLDHDDPEPLRQAHRGRTS